MLRRLTGAVFALAIVGCSTYRGPQTPDFSLTGEAREQEIQKFSLKEGFFDQGAAHVEMGGRYYWLSSVEPVVLAVSSEASATLERARFWRNAGLLSLGLAAVVLAAEMNDGDDHFSREQNFGYWGLLGFSLGSSFARASLMDRAATRYNRDLRAKFSPALGLRFEF